MNDFDIPATFWDHVDELRSTLLRILLTIALGIGVSLYFYNDIFDLMTQPLTTIQSDGLTSPNLTLQDLKKQRLVNNGPKTATYVLPAGSSLASPLPAGVLETNPRTFAVPPGTAIEVETAFPVNRLVVFGPIEGMMTMLKVCFWCGVVGSSPLWIYLALQFVAPALRSHEKKLIFPFLAFSLIFSLIGIAFAYYLTIPLANQYLYSFNSSIGLNLWSLAQYLDYTVILLLSNGLAFELSLILFFLVHYGIVSAEALKAKRRLMIVLAFIIGALLTPPDVLTQVMLALPLIGLYELTIVYAKVKERLKKAENEESRSLL